MAETTKEAAAKPGHNGYDPDKAQQFMKAYEAEEAAIEKINAEARKKAEPHKAQMKEIKNAAKKEAGINKGTFQHEYDRRKTERKLREHDAKLTEEELADAERLRAALGDFADSPLGQAAVDQAAE